MLFSGPWLSPDVGAAGLQVVPESSYLWVAVGGPRRKGGRSPGRPVGGPAAALPLRCPLPRPPTVTARSPLWTAQRGGSSA